MSNTPDAEPVVVFQTEWTPEAVAAIEALNTCGKWRKRAEALEKALTTIRDTFKRDMEQGYRTRDKVFAVEIADAALAETEEGK